MAGWFGTALDLIGDLVFKPFLLPLPFVGQLQQGWSPSLTPDGPVVPTDEAKDVWAGGWLAGMAAVPVTILGAPIAYRAFTRSYKGKRAVKAKEVGEAIDDASTRAVTLASAYLPAFGLPIAYISVQALEKKGYITKGLGDAVQSMLVAGAVAPAVGGVLQFASKLVPGVRK